MAVADDINGHHHLEFATLLRSNALVCFHTVSFPSIHVYSFWGSISMYMHGTSTSYWNTREVPGVRIVRQSTIPASNLTTTMAIEHGNTRRL